MELLYSQWKTTLLLNTSEYTKSFGYLEKRGLRPVVHKTENECTQELNDIIVDQHKNKL